MTGGGTDVSRKAGHVGNFQRILFLESEPGRFDFYLRPRNDNPAAAQPKIKNKRGHEQIDRTEDEREKRRRMFPKQQDDDARPDQTENRRPGREAGIARGGKNKFL